MDRAQLWLRVTAVGGSVLVLVWLGEDADRADTYGPWIVGGLGVIVLAAVAWFLVLRRR